MERRPFDPRVGYFATEVLEFEGNDGAPAERLQLALPSHQVAGLPRCLGIKFEQRELAAFPQRPCLGMQTPVFCKKPPFLPGNHYSIARKIPSNALCRLRVEAPGIVINVAQQSSFPRRRFRDFPNASELLRKDQCEDEASNDAIRNKTEPARSRVCASMR